MLHSMALGRPCRVDRARSPTRAFSFGPIMPPCPGPCVAVLRQGGGLASWVAWPHRVKALMAMAADPLARFLTRVTGYVRQGHIERATLDSALQSRAGRCQGPTGSMSRFRLREVGHAVMCSAVPSIVSGTSASGGCFIRTNEPR